MRISNQSHRTQNPFSYCFSSFSRETLNPQNLFSVVPSISQSTVSSLRNSSSGSSSFFSSELYPLQKKAVCEQIPRPSLIQFSALGYMHFKRSNLFTSSLSGFKSHFLTQSSNWISSTCDIGSYSRSKHQSSCYFSSGRPKLSFLQTLSSLTLPKHNSFYVHRCFTVSSSNGKTVTGPVTDSEIHTVTNISGDPRESESRNNDPSNFVFETVATLRNNGEDLESRLSASSSRLSVYSITDIFKVLNTERISGLRLFEWIWNNNPQLRRNSNVCSLIIDNFGRLDDYETMFAWLKIFSCKKICLTYEAFLFLPVLASSNSSLNESTQRVVDLLNKVGGSCRNSGICSLIEMFCKLDLFEMARHVIKITERKKSYFCLMIREKCKNGLIQDAYGMIREMQEAHCAPNTTVYNYLLGSLWKNGKADEAFALFNEMNGIGIPPDAITFEILINFVCKLGKMDDARKVLDEMMSQRIEPRPTTHACIVKTLFAAEKYEAARKHVADSGYKTSRNTMCSLMANLYQEKGDIMSARDVLVEMMKKCLKPNFSVYIKIVKQLRRIGKGNLARDLESRHAKFVIKSQV